MAQVAPAVQEHIDILLCSLLERWNDLPSAIETIDDWEVIDQIVYIEEWPVIEQRLEMLAEYAAENLMNQDQLGQYDTLLQVIEKYRPLVAKLYD